MVTPRKKMLFDKSSSTGPRKKREGHALPNNYEEGSFHNIEVDLISPNPDQPRKFFDEESLQELSNTIKRKGVLQPVLITRDETGKIFLAAGERRLKAAKMAGLEKIPAILTKGDPTEIALIENLQRENLKPMEEAEALNRIIKEHSYTQEKLAGAVGKARSTITETLSLNKLPEEIKDECRRADILPRRLLVEIARQDTPEAMLTLFRTVKDRNLTSEQVREITRPRKTRGKQRTPAAAVLGNAMALHKHLTKLDIAALKKTEKDKLLGELRTIKAAIDQFLNNSSA